MWWGSREDSAPCQKKVEGCVALCAAFLVKMSSATAEQTLLYSLRSPTTPLPAKLVLAQAALENSPSPALSQVLRDWILQDLFLRSKAPATLVSPEWWILLSQVVESAAGTTSTPTLPIFTSFLGTYAGGLEANVELVGAVVSVCRKLIGGAMRKATVDAALEGYAVLLKSSLAVMQRNGADTDAWESLTESWLKAFRGVVDAGKGGKKVGPLSCPSEPLVNHTSSRRSLSTPSHNSLRFSYSYDS